MLLEVDACAFFFVLAVEFLVLPGARAPFFGGRTAFLLSVWAIPPTPVFSLISPTFIFSTLHFRGCLAFRFFFDLSLVDLH